MTTECPNCGATEPDIKTFQPTQDEGRAGAQSELACNNCGREYKFDRNGWQLQ